MIGSIMVLTTGPLHSLSRYNAGFIFGWLLVPLAITYLISRLIKKTITKSMKGISKKKIAFRTFVMTGLICSLPFIVTHLVFTLAFANIFWAFWWFLWDFCRAHKEEKQERKANEGRSNE